MKFDFHTHHFRCGHAEGSIRDYIEAALEKGLAMIGISDHSPYFASGKDRPSPSVAMAKSEFPRYVEEVLRLKKEYAGKIEVLLGVESDYFPEHEALYRSVYDAYPFDYRIGSVHQLLGLSIFNRNRWKNLNERGRIETKDAYFREIQRSAKSGMFDILGHIDAMKGYYPEFDEIPTNELDRTLKTIAECDVAIEINTSGKTKDCGGWYPSDDILEKAHHYGVKVTFGSDAHVPDRVADEWDEVRLRLKDIGFKEWAVFRGRRRVMIPL
jgi:histidinol phosphate phosphatase HisJ family